MPVLINQTYYKGRVGGGGGNLGTCKPFTTDVPVVIINLAITVVRVLLVQDQGGLNC